MIQMLIDLQWQRNKKGMATNKYNHFGLKHQADLRDSDSYVAEEGRIVTFVFFRLKPYRNVRGLYAEDHSGKLNSDENQTPQESLNTYLTFALKICTEICELL